MRIFIQQLIFGIQLGSLYALIALGYTMVYGVLSLINFAHGDVYMVGAYIGFYACTYWLPFQRISADPHAAVMNIVLAVVVLLLSMLMCGALGVVIERFAYRPLRNGLGITDAHFWGYALSLPVAFHFHLFHKVSDGAGRFLFGIMWFLLIGVIVGYALRPVIRWISLRTVLSPSRLNALITAIGVSLLLENGGWLVFGPNPEFIGTMVPEKNFKILGGVIINSSQLAILVISLILMLILRHIVLHTRTGKAMRAISHDIEAAKMMGINTDKVISVTFAIGGALAGAGGMMVGVLTHVQITPLFGLLPGIKAFVAAVIGGPGNIPGAVLGGIIMGVAEAFVGGSSFSTYRDAIAFTILIIILLVRPAGLLGRNVAEKV